MSEMLIQNEIHTVDFGRGLVLVLIDEEPAEVENFFDENKKCMLCPEAIANMILSRVRN